MRRRRRQLLTFVTVLSLALVVAATTSAQTPPEQAGVVIVDADGITTTHCLTVSEDGNSGYDALTATGLDVVVDVSGMGVSVCRIGELGCPVDDCFCRCRGGADCQYWSYWQHVDGAWRYAAAGAHATTLVAGDIDGWVWGAGGPGNATPPPETSLAEICPLDSSVTVAPDVTSAADGNQFILYLAIAAAAAAVTLLARRSQ